MAISEVKLTRLIVHSRWERGDLVTEWCKSLV